MLKKPVIAVTTGDPCGIGPEVTLKAVLAPAVRRACKLIIIGPLPTKAPLPKNVKHLPLAEYAAGLGPDRQFRTGHPSRKGGLLSFEAVKLAAQMTQAGTADAFVTAPVSKQSWQKAGLPYTGHTEFFEEYFNSPSPAMSFAKGSVRVVTVTNHLPLKEVAAALSVKLIVEKTLKFNVFLKREGNPRPKLGIAALNPHAGDAGKIGQEEISIIAPAIAALKRKGVKAFGPLPADTLWAKHLAGEFDGIVVPYHDCALLPLKILKGGAAAVHFTAGLPVIRTSPAHGTAFDIAGKNMADPASMKAAILQAARTAGAKAKARSK